jgi:hypothetical protein
VLAADVVTADGTRLRCDATTHQELLWALRGGGEVPEPLRGRRVTVVITCYAGPAEEGDSLLRPLSRAVAPLYNSCRPLAPVDLAALSGAPATPLSARISSALLASLPDTAISELLGHVSLGSGSPLMLADPRRCHSAT